jgi:hypothetical protein
MRKQAYVHKDSKRSSTDLMLWDNRPTKGVGDSFIQVKFALDAIDEALKIKLAQIKKDEDVNAS